MIKQTIEFVPDTGTATAQDLRCTIEAEAPSQASATGSDVSAMHATARSGLSSWIYLLDNCPEAAFVSETGVLRVRLAFYVWPSTPDLAYAVTLPPDARSGTTVSLIREYRQWRFWVSGRGTLTLPWRMEEAEFAWFHDLPCVDAFCQPVPRPEIRHEHARITVSAEQDVYGLLTVSGYACGYRHEFSMLYGKIDPEGVPQKIDADTVPVSVTWLDAAGEQQRAETEVEISQCAKDLLATCSNGKSIIRIVVNRTSDATEVAYNTCTGQVLGVRRRKS